MRKKRRAQLRDARVVGFAALLIAALAASYYLAPKLAQPRLRAAPSATVIDVPNSLLPVGRPASTAPAIPAAKPSQFQYIEVTDSCGPYYQGDCVNMRTGPGAEYPVVLRLRAGMVLKVAGMVRDANGEAWYKIAQDEDIRYPDRITDDWYVYANVVRAFNDSGAHRLAKNEHPETKKHIIVKLSEEKLYAYDGDTLFMEEPISTGLDSTPTPIGTFSVYAMTPSRYMQGPIPWVSNQIYDLPGVPWNLYFTQDGAVIHGAYWHDHFGQPWSHGCVNLPPDKAQQLYEWAELGMKVTVEP